MAPSKFRDLILQSADRIVTHLSERDSKTTPAAKPSKATKKRLGKTITDNNDEGINKRLRTRATQRHQSSVAQHNAPISVQTDKVLKPMKSSKLNAKASNQRKAKTSNSMEVHECLPLIREKVDAGLFSENEFEVDQRDLDAMAKVETTTTALKQALMPETTVSGAVHSGPCTELKHSFDSFDEDESFFAELLGDTPEAPEVVEFSSNATPPTNQPMCTPIKHVSGTSVSEIATPPSLNSSLAPSPASTNISAAGSPIKAFMRPLPLSQVPVMPVSMPWLKADLRITTSFRVAEVLRLQSQPFPIGASKEQGDAVELYARIKSVVAQTAGSIVQFADIFFPSRPPYLIGECKTQQASAVTASIMSAAQSPARWSIESSQSSEHADNYKLCRAIIRTSPGSNEVYVVNIRETDWAEVEHVRGIVEPEYQSRLEEVSEINTVAETLTVRTP